MGPRRGAHRTGTGDAPKPGLGRNLHGRARHQQQRHGGRRPHHRRGRGRGAAGPGGRGAPNRGHAGTGGARTRSGCRAALSPLPSSASLSHQAAAEHREVRGRGDRPVQGRRRRCIDCGPAPQDPASPLLSRLADAHRGGLAPGPRAHGERDVLPSRSWGDRDRSPGGETDGADPERPGHRGDDLRAWRGHQLDRGRIDGELCQPDAAGRLRDAALGLDGSHRAQDAPANRCRARLLDVLVRPEWIRRAAAGDGCLMARRGAGGEPGNRSHRPSQRPRRGLCHRPGSRPDAGDHPASGSQPAARTGPMVSAGPSPRSA